MAIQNFLSGGFYGSIGELTGRRWKNKRVVQAKFKPKNPKTPAQEKQRMLFTRGSALAKIAQQVNWRAPQFTNPIKTDWNQRQTVAINALKDGATEWEALPLAPKDFVPEHKIGVCTVTEIDNDNVMKVVFEGTNLLPNKKYACAIFIQSGMKEGQIIIGSTPQPSVDALTASFRLPESDGIIGEEVYIKISSIDDTEIDTVTLSAGILLQQNTQTPYVFEPQLVSVEMDSDYTLKIKVKLGEEPIESYDAFSNINISLLDKAWTKTTAVTSDKLDTDNWENVAQTFTVSRTTVAKSTATVSFSIANTNLWQYEKFAAKLDISFSANNVKGENSAKNTENITLTSQAFPEYLQEEIPQVENIALVAKTNTIATIYGDQVLKGQMYLESDQTDAGKVITTNAEDADWEQDEIEVNSITLSDGTTLSGDDMSEMIEQNGVANGVNGSDAFWGIWEENIKSFVGKMVIQCVDYNAKIAFNGYRVYSCKPDEYYDFHINCTYN